MLTVFTLPAIAEAVDYTADANAVATYTMNETSGNVIDQTSTNDCTVNGATLNATGVYGGAVSFDGVDDYLSCGSAAELDIAEGTAVFWFKLDNLPGTVHRAIFGKDSPQSNDGDFGANYGHLAEDNRLYSFGGDATTDNGVPTNDPQVADQWYHVAMTWGSSGMTMYLDGVLQTATDPYTGGMTNTAADLNIGAVRSGIFHFEGDIDEFGLFSRVLTSSEVNAIKNCGLDGTECGSARFLTIGSSSIVGAADIVGRPMGMRDHLQDTLGVGNYDMVGQFSDGSYPPYDTDHSGVSGESTADLAARIDAVLDSQMPTPNAANSVIYIFPSYANNTSLTPQQQIDNIAASVDSVHNHDPSIVIIVSSIQPLFDGREPYDESVRALIPGMIATKNAAYGDVYFFDWHSYITATPDYENTLYAPDAVHMNETGYTLMGTSLGEFVLNGYSANAQSSGNGGQTFYPGVILFAGMSAGSSTGSQPAANALTDNSVQLTDNGEVLTDG